MCTIKEYHKKMCMFLRTHKRSRKKAAWQNALVSLLLVAICITGLVNYAEENTLEAVVKRHCERQLIDNAEICAVVTYESKVFHPGKLCKDVMVRKYTGENEFYQYTISAVKENPLKWTVTSGYYNNEPLRCEINFDLIEHISGNVYDISMAGIPGISLIELYELGKEAAIYGLSEDITAYTSDNEDGHIIDIAVNFSGQSKVPHEDFFISTQHFRVNLDTGECQQNFRYCNVRESFQDPYIVEKYLWISDDVLINVAETVAEAMETMTETSGQ